MGINDYICPRTLKDACIGIAIIHLVLTAYQFVWSVYYLTNYSHWIYYANLIVSLVSLGFHALLFVGARQERREYVYPWTIFTLFVTFPFCVLLLVICMIDFNIGCIIINLLGLAGRVYMWFKVREYSAELLGHTSTTPAASPGV